MVFLELTGFFTIIYNGFSILQFIGLLIFDGFAFAILLECFLFPMGFHSIFITIHQEDY